MMGHSVFLLVRLIFWRRKLKTKGEGPSDFVKQINAKTDREMKCEGEKKWMKTKSQTAFRQQGQFEECCIKLLKDTDMCIGWEMRQGAIYNSYCPALFLYLQPVHLEMLFQSSVGRL